MASYTESVKHLLYPGLLLAEMNFLTTILFTLIVTADLLTLWEEIGIVYMFDHCTGLVSI